MADGKSAGEIPRRFELYKTSKHFDGEPGRKQHKFPTLEELAA